MYDLMATVVHILDSRTGGSLVAHIKVGETYHQRKEVSPVVQETVLEEMAAVPSQGWPCASGRSRPAVTALSPQGVTHQQWYLFNDFLIEPIDKVNQNISVPPFMG